MKKTTTLLGILGVVGMFYACSADTVSAPDMETSTNTSSSAATGSGNSSSAGNTPKDSVVHETVVIQPAGNHAVPYPSNDKTFCWTEKCEKENAPATPKSSSSYVINVTMSSEAQNPPTINGNTMIDNRDGKEYSIERIAGTLWMTKNLNLESKTGYYCSYGEYDNLCATYGGFYTYATAQRVCPEGWRLPTKAEILAVDGEVEQSWWTIGGRFKYDNDGPTAYGLEKEQGYIWIQSEDGYSSWRVEDYDSKTEHDFQGSDAAAGRAYNVRCVSDQ